MKYRLKNFLPVPDQIVEKYGGMAGLIYGRIWRYTNGGDHDCTASVQRIATDLKVTPPTIRKYLALLIEGKEIVDLTPEQTHKPHRLNITRQMTLNLEVELGAPSDDEGVKNFSTSDDGGVKNFDSRSKEFLHKDMFKDIKSGADSNESAGDAPKKPKKAKKPRKRNLLFDAVADVCCADPVTAGSSIAKISRGLAKAGYTPEDVYEFQRWWNSDDWRRKKGAPTLWKLNERIAIIKQSRKKPLSADEKLPEHLKG